MGKRSCRGFTLPELLITIILISILLSLGIVFTSTMKSTKKMRNYEVAIALAQQAVEVLRASPFSMMDDADAKENSVEFDLNNSAQGVDLLEPTYNVNQIKYERKVEVLDVPPKPKDGTPIGLKYVKVTVKWTPPDGEKVTYEITTTISDIN